MNVKSLFFFAEFGMKEDLRKMEVGQVSSRDLYVKCEFDLQQRSTTLFVTKNQSVSAISADR